MLCGLLVVLFSRLSGKNNYLRRLFKGNSKNYDLGQGTEMSKFIQIIIMEVMKNMLRWGGVLFLVWFVAAGCNSNPEYVSIVGDAGKFSKGVVDLYVLDPESKKPVKIDSSQVDEKFSFTKVPTNSTVVMVQNQTRTEVLIFVDSEDIKMTLSDSVKVQGRAFPPKFVYEGSDAQSSISNFENLREKYDERLMFLYKALAQAKSGQASASDIAKLTLNIEDLKDKVFDERVSFLEQNATVASAPYLLLILAQEGLDDQYAKLDVIQKAFSEQQKHSFFGEVLSEFLGRFLKTKVGSVLDDFTLKNHNGKDVSLYSFKGKLLLLDFWASWCQPCRVTHPELKKHTPSISPKVLKYSQSPWIPKNRSGKRL